MFRFIRIFLLFIFTFIGVVHAAVEQTDILELKAKLEEILTNKYRTRLSARLPADLFSVGTQVTLENEKDLKEKGKGNIEPDKILKDELSPSDIGNFGFGSLMSLPEPAEPKDPKLAWKITKIEVFVGLSSRLSPEAKQKFTSWVKSNIQREFGSVGSLTVEDLPEGVKKEGDKGSDFKFDKPFEVNLNSDKPRVLGPVEKFGYFQNLVGLIALALILLAATIISKLVLSRDTKEQNTTAIKIQEMKSETAGLAPTGTFGSQAGKDSGGYNAGEINPNLVFESYRDLQRKAAFLALSFQKKITVVVDMWLDEGEDGRCKLASIIDSVLNHLGSAQTPAAGDFSFDWSMPDKAKSDKSLSVVFRIYGSMPLAEKSAILERAYWDILSAKALGAHMIKQRFSSLSQLPVPVIQRVLSAQDKKARSVTTLHLSAEKLAQIAFGLTIDEKRALVDQAFESPVLSEIELDVVDQTLTSLIQRETSNTEDTVEVPTLVPGLLAVMKALEEVELIRGLTANRPDATEFLKQNYGSMMFLGDWPKEKLKLLLGRARSSEVHALLQTIPEITDVVMEVIAARTRAMVKEDLGKKILSPDDVETNLEPIRNRIWQMIEAGEIELSKVFAKTKLQGPQGIAA